MAAGDIIVSGGRITAEELDAIATEVTNRLSATSKDPGEYEEVGSLEGITSIPVFQQSGSTYKLVRVLISILRGVDGREVYLQKSKSGYIQWRWTDGEWNNLVSLLEIKGETGETPVFRTGPAGIEWKYESEEDTAYRLLVSYDVLKLKYSDLTAEQIAAFYAGMPADVITLFQQPATDAAAEVREKMTVIEQSATEVIAGAETAKNTATEVIVNVNRTNNEAIEAENARVTSELLRVEEEKKRSEVEVSRVEAEKLRLGKEAERTEAERLRLEKELERIEAELERVEAEALRVKESKTALDNAVAATDLATDAATLAQEVANHSTYIGSDHYVYKWNKETKAYDKTDIFVKGEAFSIKKVYTSVSEMEADTDNAEIKEGDFVLINTSDVENPDNARLYIKTSSGFDFLVDMSGAIGFTGKTPQLGIGTVSGGDAAAVSLSEDGTDSDGNPKFKLNLVLPRGEKGDTPVLSAGTVTTGEPGTPASAELVADGTTDTGIPCYRLDLTIPEGRQGSGNVSVPPEALKASVTYLFKPSADGSAEGEFIEYVPAPPEQADWSVADAALPSFIKNKPESMKANGGNADTLNNLSISLFLTKDPGDWIEADITTITCFGFGYASRGWPTNGSFLSFGGFSNDTYQVQLQGGYIDNNLYFRNYNSEVKSWKPWKKVATEGDPQPASDVHPWAKQPNKPVYKYNEIADAEYGVTEPNKLIKRDILSLAKLHQGYISRFALGLSNPDNQFSPGSLLLGVNDEGTIWTEYMFCTDGSVHIYSTTIDDTFTAARTHLHTLAFTTSTVTAARGLATPRTINGTYFDGTGNIVTSSWGAARNISFVNDVAASFYIDGSQNLALPIEVQRVTGAYAGNGGQQPPSYIASGKIQFAMMNTPVNGDTSYKDWMLMDTYAGVDVPWVTAFGMTKSGQCRAFIMSGVKGSNDWLHKEEIWTTANFNPDAYQTKQSYKNLGFDNLSGIDGSFRVYNVVLSNSATFPALPDPTTKNGTEFTVVVFCAGMTTINLPVGANYVNMNGNTISVPHGNLSVELSFLCSGNKWRSTFIIQPD